MEERKTREKNIILKGLPETAKDDKDKKKTRSSDLKAILELADSLGVEAGDGDIKWSRRIGKSENGKHRPVIVTLKSMELKDRFMEKRRHALNTAQIKIDQDLTKAQLEALSELYEEANERNKKLDNNSSFRWTVKGPRTSPFLGKMQA